MRRLFVSDRILTEGTEEIVFPTMLRVAAYALSSLVAFVFYVSWIAGEVPGPGSFSNRILAALFLCMFGGFSAAIVSMTLPWIVVVWIYRKLRLSGAVYFALLGGLMMVVAGSVTSSVSPKPLFIEDQTFFGGVLIALQRQGVCLTMAGTIIGLGYWFLGEKRLTERTIRKRNPASPFSPAQHDS